MGYQYYSSRGLSQSRDLTYVSYVSCIADKFFTTSRAWEALLKGAPEPKCEEAWFLQALELPWQGPGARDALTRAAVAQAPCRPASLAGGMWACSSHMVFWPPHRDHQRLGCLALGTIQTPVCSVGEFGSSEGRGDGLRVADNLSNNNVKEKMSPRAAPLGARTSPGGE